MGFKLLNIIPPNHWRIRVHLVPESPQWVVQPQRSYRTNDKTNHVHPLSETLYVRLRSISAHTTSHAVRMVRDERGKDNESEESEKKVKSEK